jgi:inhibitor of cysteine peptidase
MAVSDATLTATNATLTDRTVGSASDLSLTVATGTTPTKVDICEAATTGSYTIAGTITYNGSALSGVTVTLSGGTPKTTTTDEDGEYSFSDLSSSTYTITPSKSGYAFTPSSKQVTASCAVQLGVDFTATTSGTTYSISGKVTLSGSGLSGVTMTLPGSGSGTATTDSSGNYTFSGLSNGTYTITPSKSGYTFTPASLSVTISGANKTGQNFTATQSTSGCSQWSDVIEKYNQYVGGQADWADVISCYSDYVTP